MDLLDAMAAQFVHDPRRQRHGASLPALGLLGPRPVQQGGRVEGPSVGRADVRQRSWSPSYARSFLCSEFSIDGDLRHAGYIQTWIGLLKADSRAFFTACNKAQAAADYLRGLALAGPTKVAA